ncbi:rCG40862 [Rattus norvegicus]|uniref:RCG40862 n=1 Tax=Rattus norvegicus TaxID=10116 RepID=A6KKW4_RAT|nr:rCG40862 [Rattus norvegicus]
MLLPSQQCFEINSTGTRLPGVGDLQWHEHKEPRPLTLHMSTSSQGHEHQEGRATAISEATETVLSTSFQVASSGMRVDALLCQPLRTSSESEPSQAPVPPATEGNHFL